MRSHFVAFFALLACDASADIKPGSLTSSGRLVMHVFQQAKTGNPLIVELESDYGYMVINTGKTPAALYRLASNRTKKIEDFTEFEDFKSAVAKIPRGSPLIRYDKCLAPSYYGLSFDLEAFERFCAELGLRVSDEDHVTCTCAGEG